MAAPFDRSLDEADKAADRVITLMTVSATGCSILPEPGSSIALSTMLGAGVVWIGKCYGVNLTGEDGWKLIIRFFMAAGFGYMARAVGLKLISAILKITGVPYIIGVVLDAAVSAAIAYAIGCSAKAYFRGECRKAELGRVLRQAFEEQKLHPVHS